MSVLYTIEFGGFGINKVSPIIPRHVPSLYLSCATKWLILILLLLLCSGHPLHSRLLISGSFQICRDLQISLASDSSPSRRWSWDFFVVPVRFVCGCTVHCFFLFFPFCLLCGFVVFRDWVDR